MAKWRTVAIEQLPELRGTIDASENVMALWIELGLIYEHGHKGVDQNDLNRRIHSYAEWCVQAPRNDAPEHDPPTAVQVAFYEHLDDK